MPEKKTLRKCAHGHSYYKSSDCPTCPVCEAAKKTATGFLSLLSAPARRALEKENISTLKQLSHYSEKEILSWHGIGPTASPKLKQALQQAGLTFKTASVSKTDSAKSTKKLTTTYHADGSIWAKGTMKNNQPDGYWEWFRKDGVIMRSGYFTNGKQTGEWITYDKAGRIYKVSKMKAAL